MRDPKGVMITQVNLLNNGATLATALGISEESSILTAPRLFRDMGLILGVLQPIWSELNPEDQ
jgi:acyl-CoA synthetase (AMP-forming)/AMP-acid ligase II